MYKGLIDQIFEGISIAQARQNFATPDVRPCLFDESFDAWLERLAFWGKVEISHFDPETKKVSKITQGEFLKAISNPTLFQAFGKWHIERTDVNKVTLFREYVGLNGKKYVDKFFVVVNLSKDLQGALK